MGGRWTIPVALLVSFVMSASLARAQDAKALATQVLQKYDADMNGRINDKECADEEVFRTYDRNRDRVITRKEIEETVDPKRAKAAAMARRPRGINAFMEYDEDEDGELSAREFGEYLFGELDRDYTEQLNAEELGAGYVPVQLRGGGNPLQNERRKLDKDDNGVVDKAEWEVPRSYFKALDRDNSGTIAKDELVLEALENLGGLPGFSGVDMFQRRDKDKDKNLSNSEFEGSRELFDRVDADKDKLVSIEEYNNFMDRIRSVMRNADDPVVRFDLNGDGKVTRAEFPGSDNAFARADTNGDGLLTRSDQVPRR